MQPSWEQHSKIMATRCTCYTDMATTRNTGTSTTWSRSSQDTPKRYLHMEKRYECTRQKSYTMAPQHCALPCQHTYNQTWRTWPSKSVYNRNTTILVNYLAQTYSKPPRSSTTVENPRHHQPFSRTRLEQTVDGRKPCRHSNYHERQCSGLWWLVRGRNSILTVQGLGSVFRTDHKMDEPEWLPSAMATSKTNTHP